MSPINAPHRPAISATYGVWDAFRMQGFEFTDGLPPSHGIFAHGGVRKFERGRTEIADRGVGGVLLYHISSKQSFGGVYGMGIRGLMF